MSVHAISAADGHAHERTSATVAARLPLLVMRDHARARIKSSQFVRRDFARRSANLILQDAATRKHKTTRHEREINRWVAAGLIVGRSFTRVYTCCTGLLDKAISRDVIKGA